MDEQTWQSVDEYFAGQLFAPDPVLDAALEANALAGLPAIDVSPAAGKLLHLLARSVGARRILEVGTLGLVDVRVGAALDTLSSLEGPFDLAFIDADKQSNAEYFRHALRLSRPGTVIVVDNVVRGGRVTDADSPDPDVRGTRALTAAVAQEPRVEATAIQTVGSKGYDGFLLAIVR